MDSKFLTKFLQKDVSTLAGIIIILFSAIILFGGAFAYQNYLLPK